MQGSMKPYNPGAWPAPVSPACPVVPLLHRGGQPDNRTRPLVQGQNGQPRTTGTTEAFSPYEPFSSTWTTEIKKDVFGCPATLRKTSAAGQPEFGQNGARRKPLKAPFILPRSGVNALDTMSGLLPIWTPTLTGLLTSSE